MAEPALRFEIKDYGFYDKYMTIKKKDNAYEYVDWNMEAMPMPSKSKTCRRKIAVGYRALKVDIDNKQTHGVVTYVSPYGADFIVKITWEDGYIDHSYLSKMLEQFAIWKQE